MNLGMFRAEIDRIDRELVALFLKRMGVSEDIARVKSEMGISLVDMSRERQVVDNATLGLDGQDRQDVEDFMKTLMEFSKRRQKWVERRL